MQITPHFTFEEMTYSLRAQKEGIRNEPGREETVAITRLVCCLLEPARQRYGKRMIISSGFRCEKLNRSVNGKTSSQHRKGEAADIVADDMQELFDIFAEMEHDQLLFEHNSKGDWWLHVSYKATGNRNITIADYDADK